MDIQEYTAIVLNDYEGGKHYATWVKEQKKKIETRMKHTTHRGDIVICCGNKSVTSNRGKALCIVDLYDSRDMTDEDVKDACIENAPKRKAFMLRNWRYFSRDFQFNKRYVSGSYQWLFKITIPEDVKILTESEYESYINQSVKL